MWENLKLTILKDLKIGIQSHAYLIPSIGVGGASSIRVGGAPIACDKLVSDKMAPGNLIGHSYIDLISSLVGQSYRQDHCCIGRTH